MPGSLSPLDSPQPNPLLAAITGLLDSGQIRVFVDMEIPLYQAPAAYTGRLRRVHGYGKVVVVVAKRAHSWREL